MGNEHIGNFNAHCRHQRLTGGEVKKEREGGRGKRGRVLRELRGYSVWGKVFIVWLNFVQYTQGIFTSVTYARDVHIGEGRGRGEGGVTWTRG